MRRPLSEVVYEESSGGGGDGDCGDGDDDGDFDGDGDSDSARVFSLSLSLSLKEFVEIAFCTFSLRFPTFEEEEEKVRPTEGGLPLLLPAPHIKAYERPLKIGGKILQHFQRARKESLTPFT